MQRLHLNNTEITSSGFVHLEDLQLQTLGFSRAKVGPTGFANVVKLQTLKRLHFDGTSVADANHELISTTTSAEEDEESDALSSAIDEVLAVLI